MPFLLLKAVGFDVFQSDVFTCEVTHLTAYREVCILHMGCNAEVNYAYTILLQHTVNFNWMDTRNYCF